MKTNNWHEWNKAMDDSIEFVDRYDRFAQLYQILPWDGDWPKELYCEKCDYFLGVVANSNGVGVATFKQIPNESSVLSGGARSAAIQLPEHIYDN